MQAGAATMVTRLGPDDPERDKPHRLFHQTLGFAARLFPGQFNGRAEGVKLAATVVGVVGADWWMEGRLTGRADMADMADRVFYLPHNHQALKTTLIATSVLEVVGGNTRLFNILARVCYVAYSGFLAYAAHQEYLNYQRQIGGSTVDLACSKIDQTFEGRPTAAAAAKAAAIPLAHAADAGDAMIGAAESAVSGVQSLFQALTTSSASIDQERASTDTTRNKPRSEFPVLNYAVAMNRLRTAICNFHVVEKTAKEGVLWYAFVAAYDAKKLVNSSRIFDRVINLLVDLDVGGSLPRVSTLQENMTKLLGFMAGKVTIRDLPIKLGNHIPQAASTELAATDDDASEPLGLPRPALESWEEVYASKKVWAVFLAMNALWLVYLRRKRRIWLAASSR